MTWFLMALAGPLAYAITCHLDRFLLEKYFDAGGVGALVVMSLLMSLLAAPIIYLFDPSVLEIGPVNIVIMAFVGVLNLGVIGFYLLALQDDEASVVSLYYQLVPVFALVLGYVVLGEVLTTVQLVAMAIILVGTGIVSIEIEARQISRFRIQTMVYMCLAATCWAGQLTLFKLVALEANVWRTLFWEHVALFGLGLLIYAFLPRMRSQLQAAWRENSSKMMRLNIASEGLAIAASAVVSFALLMAPIAMVMLAESFQAILVFVVGLVLTVLFPKLSSENIRISSLAQKFIALGVSGAGTVLLLMKS